MMPRAPRQYYPMFADLTGRRCVVVGGGMVAQRKVMTLLRYGAHVTVVSPQVTRRLAVHARHGKIRLVERRFRPEDLRGAWLVYAATDDQAINALVHETASRARIFTNIVDQPSLCSFIAPAILRRDPLVIAISTGGASPSLAKRLRRELERTIGSDYARMLRLLRDLRGIAKQRLPSNNDRRRYFDQLVRGRTFAFVRQGKTVAARREALALLKTEAKRNRN